MAAKKENNNRRGFRALIPLVVALSAFVLWGVIRAAFPPLAPPRGQMEARTISVASKSPGRVAKILVREGEMVHKDQPVAQIAPPGPDARLNLARGPRPDPRLWPPPYFLAIVAPVMIIRLFWILFAEGFAFAWQGINSFQNIPTTPLSGVRFAWLVSRRRARETASADTDPARIKPSKFLHSRAGIAARAG